MRAQQALYNNEFVLKQYCQRKKIFFNSKTIFHNLVLLTRFNILESWFAKQTKHSERICKHLK